MLTDRLYTLASLIVGYTKGKHNRAHPVKQGLSKSNQTGEADIDYDKVDIPKIAINLGAANLPKKGGRI